MLDSIFSEVKGELTKVLGGKFDLNEAKTDQVLDETKETVQSGLMNELTSGNISGLKSLFNGESDIASNPIVGNIVNQLVESLISKVGLSPNLASSIGTFVIPFVMNKISGKQPAGGFDLSSLTSMLSSEGSGLGETLKSGLGGALGGSLGKLLG